LNQGKKRLKRKGAGVFGFFDLFKTELVIRFLQANKGKR
jgi:hypothetical protein